MRGGYFQGIREKAEKGQNRTEKGVWGKIDYPDAGAVGWGWGARNRGRVSALKGGKWVVGAKKIPTMPMEEGKDVISGTVGTLLVLRARPEPPLSSQKRPFARTTH